MKKIFIPLDGAEEKGVTKHLNTPICKKHGAMNKVSQHEDGGGIWRCISVVNDKASTVCRRGLIEKRIYERL